MIPRAFGGYKAIKPLGHGTFSEVYLVEDSCGNQYAAKIVDGDVVRKKGFYEHFQTELRVMQRISHQHIAACKEVLNVGNFIIVIMEYCSMGDLHSFIYARKRLSEREALIIIRHILEALEYLHNQGISHRDIKPENIVFDKSMTPKLIDFGFSTDNMQDGNLQRTQCGSLAFVAPELFTSFGYDAKRADIWSLGITLYVMVTGMFPWNISNNNNILKQIYLWDCEIPDYVPRTLKSLLQRMLVKEPCMRATASQLLDSKTDWAKINASSMGDIEISLSGPTVFIKPVSQTPEPLCRRRTIIRPNLKPKKLKIIDVDIPNLLE